jgi:hypothetical protein
MDQQSIFPYLSRKGLSTVAIHEDLVATLGADVVRYPSVARYLREAIFSSSNPPEHQLDDFDPATLRALAHEPLASIREF